MKLQPSQIVGLVVVVIFGGVLAWTYLGAAPMHDAPAIANAPTLNPIPSVAPPSPLTPMTAPPPVPSDPTSVGSGEAKDDLYCGGAIYAAHRASSDPADTKEKRRVLMVPALASAGADKLIKEGVASRETTAQFADAHTDRAMKDYAAGKLRISLAACEARAEAALKALGQ